MRVPSSFCGRENEYILFYAVNLNPVNFHDFIIIIIFELFSLSESRQASFLCPVKLLSTWAPTHYSGGRPAKEAGSESEEEYL
jgi:hypothetical protein